MAGESDLALKRALLEARPRVGAMANSKMQKALSPPLYHLTHIRPLEGHGTQRLGNPVCTDMKDEAIQKR